jgi:hypothetical protein
MELGNTPCTVCYRVLRTTGGYAVAGLSARHLQERKSNMGRAKLSRLRLAETHHRDFVTIFYQHFEYHYTMDHGSRALDVPLPYSCTRKRHSSDGNDSAHKLKKLCTQPSMSSTTGVTTALSHFLPLGATQQEMFQYGPMNILQPGIQDTSPVRRGMLQSEVRQMHSHNMPGAGYSNVICGESLLQIVPSQSGNLETVPCGFESSGRTFKDIFESGYSNPLGVSIHSFTRKYTN